MRVKTSRATVFGDDFGPGSQPGYRRFRVNLAGDPANNPRRLSLGRRIRNVGPTCEMDAMGSGRAGRSCPISPPRGRGFGSELQPGTIMSYPQHEPHKPFSPEIEEGYPAEPEKKSRGCFFYGCLTLILLLLLTVVSLGIIGYYFYGKFNELVNTYTSTTSEPIPKVDYSEAQRKELHDRWDAFKKSVEAGKASEIVLTSDDVNSLLEDNPELRGVAYVTIKDGEVSGKISLPLDRFVIFGKGRFLNGNVVVTPKLENGFLDVRLKSGECNGKKMSEDGVEAPPSRTSAKAS